MGISTSSSSYLPLPDWIAKKKAVINPKNKNDKEHIKWTVSATLRHVEIKSNPERISKLRIYVNN